MAEIVPTSPCRSCGTAVFEDAAFCSACGIRVKQSESTVALVKDFAAGTLVGAEDAAKDLLKNGTVKKLAGGAALGVGAATVIPFLSLTAGATIGMVFVGYKLLTKD